MDNTRIDLNLLRVFDAMIQYGNVSVAARHVGLSQSAMSSALGRLRYHFSDDLFVKTRGGMLPTSRAQHLAGPIGEALALVRKAMMHDDEFDPAIVDRTFRIYMTDVGEMVFLPLLIERLRASGPFLSLRTMQPPADQVASALEGGSIDVALGYLPRLKSPVQQAKLWDDHYVCMTRHDHPLGSRSAITMKEFASAQHILIDSLGGGHEAIEHALKTRGIQRNVALHVPHFVSISTIVATSDLLVTIPSRMAAVLSRLVKVKIHTLPFSIPSMEVSLFWHQRFENSLENRWLRSIVMDLFAELVPADY